MNCSNNTLLQYRKNQSVVCTELDEGGILLDLNTKYYYHLNETGLRIWQLINECREQADITDSLIDEYEIKREHAEACVIELMQELDKNGLILSSVKK